MVWKYYVLKKCKIQFHLIHTEKAASKFQTWENRGPVLILFCFFRFCFFIYVLQIASFLTFDFAASELANLKENIERRESGGPGADFPAPGSATLGADKIAQLTAEMRTLRRRVSEVQEEAEGLRRAKHELEARIRAVEGERDEAVKQSSQVLGEYCLWNNLTQELKDTSVTHI